MNIAIFCNNSRGLKVINFLKKKYNIKLIFFSKKNLNKKIYEIVKTKKIKCTIVKKLNSQKIYDQIQKANIDINIVAGFPYIFNNKMINSAKFGTLNLHAGRLPKYRGGSPLNWQIINNEKKIGISIIKINRKIDDGKLIAKSNFRISHNDNITDITKKAENEFLRIIEKGIKNLVNKKFLRKFGKSSYYRQRKDSDSEIIFKRMTALEIKNLVRACKYPYNAFYKKNDLKKYVKKVITLRKKDLKFYNKKYIFYCKKGQIFLK